MFRDSGHLEVAGLLTPRLESVVSAGLVEGQSALNLNSSSFDAYTGRASVRWAFERAVAIYAEYLYYSYDLRGASALAPGLPSTFVQHGVRVGVMVWSRPVGR